MKDPVQVHFDAERELIDAVDTMLADMDYSRSQWLRKLLRESLQQHEKEQP